MVNNPPCNWGDPVGPLDSVEGPKVRYQMGQLLNQTPLSRLRSYFLQNQEPFIKIKSGYMNQFPSRMKKNLKTLHGESLKNQEPLGEHPKIEDFLVLAGQWCLMVLIFVAK